MLEFSSFFENLPKNLIKSLESSMKSNKIKLFKLEILKLLKNCGVINKIFDSLFLNEIKEYSLSPIL